MWRDTANIVLGEQVTRATRSGIEDSDAFIICLSRSANQSLHVRRELRWAIEMTHSARSTFFIIPIRLEDCEIPAELEGIRYVDLFDTGRRIDHQGWRRLIEALSQRSEYGEQFDPERLLRINSVSEIAMKSDDIWKELATDTDFAQEWRPILERFDRISSATAQYLAVHNQYRKKAALEGAANECLLLKKTLADSTGRYAVRFHRAARDWSTVVQLELESFQTAAKDLREIPNPFVFGKPIGESNSDIFTGRGDIVNQIETSILGSTTPPMLLLHGSRRMGKTSILNQLPRLLGTNFVPITIDCQDPSLRSSASAFFLTVITAAEAALFRRGLGTKQDWSVDREPFGSFKKWISGLESRLPEDTKLLVCFDEYERLSRAVDDGWGLNVLDSLRHAYQFSRKVILMFCGANTFSEMGAVWTDRFISAKRIRVSFLTQHEVDKLLTAPIQGFNMNYEPGTLGQIWRATNGQPFVTQAVAFELVQTVNTAGNGTATMECVNKAFSATLDSGGEYFANMWYDAGQRGQEVLLAVANDLVHSQPLLESVRLKSLDILDSTGAFSVRCFVIGSSKKRSTARVKPRLIEHEASMARSR